jgi:UDP:flavonoid glycosyltransferase YjiC (YdhE family)
MPLSHPYIYIGFGFIPFASVETLRKVLVKQVQRPVVLVGTAMMILPSGERQDSKLLYCIDNVPYAWLLPQCSMMMSHGGAGVVHGTLRAGIPAVIAPFTGDQFFLAALLERKGWGVQACSNLATLIMDDVVLSIAAADKCAAACRELGVVMSGIMHAPAEAAALVMIMEAHLAVTARLRIAKC